MRPIPHVHINLNPGENYMNKEELLRTAALIPQATQSDLAEHAAQRDEMVAKLNTIMLDRPDITELVGENNLALMQDNHANHARFVESYLQNPNPEMLVETVLWVFRSYRSRGFQPSYWSAQLNNWVELLKKELSPEGLKPVYPLYHWMIVNLPVFTLLSDEAFDAADNFVPSHG